MNLKEKILNRINNVLEGPRSEASYYMELTNIIETIYGPNSAQLRVVEKLEQHAYDGDGRTYAKHLDFVGHLRDCLNTIKADIEGGLVERVQSHAQREIIGDFIELAREALNAGQKNVAAVLACAALEDSLKRTAKDRDLDVYDKVMSEVINALKSVGEIRSGEAKTLGNYVNLRDSAFHAQWDEFEDADVEDVIEYTKDFLDERFPFPHDTDNAAKP